MTLCVHLLGRPCLTRETGEVYHFRSRKSWALLAYLVLSERAPTRPQLASLLFAEADDPLRALRWSLSEIRRGLGDEGSADGDPVVLRLGAEVSVDVRVVTAGRSAEAVALPGLGSDLLEGISIRNASAFDTWLLSQQRHLAATCEAVLHEAALASMSQGDFDRALRHAVRAASMAPFDENHQALLIRLYRLAGDDEAAARQYTGCCELFERELSVTPGAAVQRARYETMGDSDELTDATSIEAVIEAGTAAVSAGAVFTGLQSLRTAVRLADKAEAHRLRVDARLVLAETLIHSLRGLDEEGLAALHEADRIALANDDRASAARARAELGYVDFLRARYGRAQLWLTEAIDLAGDDPSTRAKAVSYLGSVESDRGNYATARRLLGEAVELSHATGDPRTGAYALSMLGRVELLCGDLPAATQLLDESVDLAERDRWLAFLPWPQALLGGVHLAAGHVDRASELLLQAFARACQLGDPCWEGMAARGLALMADGAGEPSRAFELLADARVRCNRLADPYVWLDGYILDAQCELGLRHNHSATTEWIEAMSRLAARTGMKELTVRSMLHEAALGREGGAAAAHILGADVDNPMIETLLRSRLDAAGLP